MGESPAGVAFDLKQPGEVAEKLIPLRDNGFAVMVLVERKSPDDAEWTKERENIVAGRRVKKQREALILYLARLRKTHQAEISQNAEFLPKPSTSASAGPPGGAPNPFDVPLGDE